jgi:NAD+ diphosphatase
MTFIAGLNPPEEVPENAFWFLFQNQKMFIKKEREEYSIPRSSDLEKLDLTPTTHQYLGSFNGIPCFAGELSDIITIPDNFSFQIPLTVFRQIDEELAWIMGLANQLVFWSRNHRYCGKCGKKMEEKTDERAKICPQCGLINYPRLSPAIIVAVIKGNRILLARPGKAPANFYSVLAGFVEPGESLKECVKREVREEVGIDVKNIRYFDSQPWPFPDSLMIGFTAEYAGGKIQIDNSEIVEADWFTAADLPSVPPKISIAGRLIEWFSEKD